MTRPKIGWVHLILAMGLMVIGLILMFDALSSGATGRPSWFFQNSYHDVEWFWGICALFFGVVWVAGRVGWWIVRTVVHWWIHQLLKDAR